MLRLEEGRKHSIAAIDLFPKNVPLQRINETLRQNQSQTGGLAQVLEIKVNARVMLTVNVGLEDRLVNGQLGTIKHIELDLYGREHSWVPIDKLEVNIRVKSIKNSSPIIKRTQYPLMLAWAGTVHKVQGLSLEKIVVSFQLLKQRLFNYGQIYVVLSCVMTIEGLYILESFNVKAIKADPKALQEYNRLRAGSYQSCGEY